MDTLDALRLFVKVADVGSFSAVARGRALAVSTVTLAIQQLEQQVGSTLLQRTTRKVSLTEEGQVFYQHAHAVLQQWQQGMEAVQPLHALRGDIHMAAPSLFAQRTLLPLLDAFMALHPEVNIHVLVSDGDINLNPSRLDVALLTGPLPDSGLRARRLLTGQRVLCASPQYWQQHGKPQHPHDLQHYQCLYLSKPGLLEHIWSFQQAEQRFDVKVKGRRTANDMQLLWQWTLSHQGISMHMPWDIAAELSSGQLETALEDYPASAADLYAVFPKNPTARCQSWVAFLAQALHS